MMSLHADRQELFPTPSAHQGPPFFKQALTQRTDFHYLFGIFCSGQIHTATSHESSRRFLTQGNHLAHNLREVGLCNVLLLQREVLNVRSERYSY
jgi:hypothetical protein